MYNKYINTISSKVEILRLIPMKEFQRKMSKLCLYEISEPDDDVSIPYFYELYFASNFYHALLQNIACEQSARMNAMENASKNAKEILEKLILQYNKARQGRITMELCEIISGASAI